MTINKYLKENKNLEFRQFNVEIDAIKFMKEVEQEVNNLIVTPDNKNIQKDKSIVSEEQEEDVNQKILSEAASHSFNKYIDPFSRQNIKQEAPIVLEDDIYEEEEEQIEGSHAMDENKSKLSKEDMVKFIRDSINRFESKNTPKR